MNYAEAAYFDGNHCQHVVTYNEHARLKRAERMARELVQCRSR